MLYFLLILFAFKQQQRKRLVDTLTGISQTTRIDDSVDQWRKAVTCPKKGERRHFEHLSDKLMSMKPQTTGYFQNNKFKQHELVQQIRCSKCTQQPRCNSYHCRTAYMKSVGRLKMRDMKMRDVKMRDMKMRERKMRDRHEQSWLIV